MALIKNMTSVVWNDYWVYLAAALLPYAAQELDGIAHEYVVIGMRILGVAAVTTLAWMRKESKTL